MLLCNSSTGEERKRKWTCYISSPFIGLLKASWTLLFAQPTNDDRFSLHNPQHPHASPPSPKAFERQEVLLLLFTHGGEVLQVQGPDLDRSLACTVVEMIDMFLCNLKVPGIIGI